MALIVAACGDLGCSTKERSWCSLMPLRAKGAESEGIVEASLASLACVCDPLGRPRLRPFVQEDDPGAVDNVGLHTGDVQDLLYLGDTNYIVIGGAADLHNPVILVRGGAGGAERVADAIEAEEIALALVGESMVGAGGEEAGLEQRQQPPGPRFALPLHFYEQGRLWRLASKHTKQWRRAVGLLCLGEQSGGGGGQLAE
eukprot:TRINITY_DN14996_c0_g1_i1.p1 TRINITY_DN14996_c0_g1~~TRINITY_DN14996_c0_g1_i1.p1  ORF type:complete len:200 (+),score=19.39 TRINITY_DN14996_c0_g1_i1:913-1512(+)